MSREAMQMALEALEDANDVARMEFSDENYYSEAINALRQALETERKWVGLTDGEIDILSCETVKGDKSVNWLCKVLEAKLKEKNYG